LCHDHPVSFDRFVSCDAVVAALTERTQMARKPNYKFERLERQRAKTAKKAARTKAKEEKVEQRKAELAGPAPADGESQAPTDDESQAPTDDESVHLP
jgi:hypothetical protein